MIVVDVGNSNFHLGVFHVGRDDNTLPEPQRTLTLQGNFQDSEIADWLSEDTVEWVFGSVNASAADQIIQWIETHRPSDRIRNLIHRDLPISILVDSPGQVGIDRLAAAVAANRLRSPLRTAIVVDAGTAVTVDVVSHGGEFLGGLIYPGFQVALDSLAGATDQLPQLSLSCAAPNRVGRNTSDAIQSGIFWSSVFGLNGILQQLAESYGPADIFATGGAASLMMPYLPKHVRYVPHLVLSGLAIATQ